VPLDCGASNWGRGSGLPAAEEERCVSQKPTAGGTGRSEGLGASGFSGTTAHSLCAWCQMQG